MKTDPDNIPKCVEKGTWTPIPLAPPPPMGNPQILNFADVDAAEALQIQAHGAMTFHAVGCSGDFDHGHPGRAVAEAMASQFTNGSSPAASFLFHLGDVVYMPDKKSESVDPPAGEDDQTVLYTTQFYEQYWSYPKQIFAIPGNHDGKPAAALADAKTASIQHFLDNFCQTTRGPAADNHSQPPLQSDRQTMNQPYPYWVLETPVAHLIGLYTNVANGGHLDDPAGPPVQSTWLVQTLQRIGASNDGRAIVLLLHYPVYSGATNFAQRGDPNARIPGDVPTLAAALQAAFQAAQCFPDLVLSAHAHHYQSLTYSYGDPSMKGRQIPFLIVGSGGHYPLEGLLTACADDQETYAPVPFTPRTAVLPDGLPSICPDQAMVVDCNDQSFGFVSITIDLNAQQIVGNFCAIGSGDKKPVVNLTSKRAFTLDLRTHTVQN